jgi:hypothetical protein
MSQNTAPRGYSIIEPSIYEALDENMDQIIACLEVIRMKLPEIFSEFPESITYEIIPLKNPFGGPYPVIGFYSDNPKDLELVPEDLDWDEHVDIWINTVGIDFIKQESQKIQCIDWKTLQDNRP